MSTATTPKTTGGVSGALTQWIARRLAEYVEPTRTMRPRGVPVAFSKTKFAAVLGALTTESPADQAARLGISRAQLYNWLGEAAFKARVEAEAARFVGLLRSMILPVWENSDPRARIAYVFEDGGEVFADGARYGHPVLEALKRRRDSETDTGAKLALNDVVREVAARALSETAEGRALLRAQLRLEWWPTAGSLIDMVFDHFDGRAVSREEAIQAAELLRRTIGDRWLSELPEHVHAERAAAAAYIAGADSATRNGRVVPSQGVTKAP